MASNLGKYGNRIRDQFYFHTDKVITIHGEIA